MDYSLDKLILVHEKQSVCLCVRSNREERTSPESCGEKNCQAEGLIGNVELFVS